MDPAPEPTTGSDAPSHNITKRRRPLVPEDKRKRVRAACFNCRSNKLKCDGIRPCHRCQNAKITCLFVHQQTSDRGTAQYPIPSEREQLLESMLRDHGISVPTHEPIAYHMSHSDTGGREHSRRPLELDPVERVQTTNPLLAEDERQKTREQVEADDSNSSIVVEHAPTSQTYVHDQGRTFFDAGFSAWAFVDSVRNAVPGTKPLQVLSRRETTAYRHYIADATTPEIPQGLGNFRTGLLAALPPHDVLRFLSATFFRYCQSNYFWLHPAIYTRKLDAFLAGTHEFSAEYAESKKRPVEFVCVLFMVLALGSQFAALEQDDEDDASAVPSPTEVYRDASIATMDPLQIKTPTPKASPGWRFYLVSQRLLTDVVTSCSMTSIQACGLQGQFLAPTTAHDAAYNVIGVAVRMCVNMGLHRSFGGDKLHPHVRELRNRLWWSVYLLDRFFGFWMGRPTMVDDNDINTPFPEDLAELKMEQPTGSVEGQIALVRVSRIMQSIVKKIYPNLKSSSETPLVINIDAFLDLQSQLDEWKAQLPPSLRLSPTSTRGSVHLHLGQQHAVMLLTRTALSQVAATKSSTMAGTQQGSEYKAQFLHNAAMSCVRAASNTIHMLQSLRDRKLLCRYSCQDPLFCTAALCVLLLGVKIQSPDADMKKVIIQGVSILQKLGEGSETAASSLAGIVKGFQPYFQPSGQTTSSRPIRMEPSLMVDRGQGHKAWESWMQQSPGTAESMLSTNQVDDDACQAANVVSIQNMLQNTDEASIVTQLSQNQPPENFPDYQYLAFDNAMDTWTAGHAYWFADLDNMFEGYGA